MTDTRENKKGISSMFMSSGTELSPGTTIFRLTAFYTILSEVDNCNHGCISWFHSTKPQLALQLRHPDTLRAHVPLGQVCALTYLQKRDDRLGAARLRKCANVKVSG